MLEARVYQCPVCGAFAKERAPTCAHCSTLLASLRCDQCFELNFPEDLHCRGCGHELGLALDGEDSDQTCPACKVPLKGFRAASGELQACERCGGQMVSHGLLRALLEQREVLGSAAPSLATHSRGNPLSDPVRYRPCPGCHQLMNRKNFGGVSGIVVDVCSRHGTFFDAGELPRVLAFVRQGGLAKAQAVLRGRPQVPATSSNLSAPPAIAAPGMLDDLLDLLAFVVDALRDR
jgi:Zn-finger nucleic acid-binding protein